MLLPTAEAQKYADQLDHLLLQLKNQLLMQSKNTSLVQPSLKNLDEYLMELNTYYYASFHQKFFPLYRQIIEADTRSLYNIGLQEATLKKDVVTSIKQHARLFNKVKSLSAILQVKRDEMNQFMLESSPGNDERIVELLYILKELAHDWADFQAKLTKLQILLADQQLLNILKHYPAHAAVVNLITKWEDDLKANRELNRLMADWQLAVKLLVKLQENQPPTKENIRAVKAELQKIDLSWDNRKIPAAARSWYKQYIQKTFSFYVELINLYGEKNDFKHSSRVAGQFEEWLKGLLYVLEQSLLYKSLGDSELIANVFLLNCMDGDYLKELAAYCSRILPSLEELINTLSSLSQADYQYHSQRSNQVIAEAYQFFQLQIDNNVKTRGILLFAKMEKLRNKLALLENRIDLVEQKMNHSLAIAKRYQLSLDMLNSLIELLFGMQEELIKSLSPRNINNNYPDMDVQINYVPLKIGDLFPPHLLHFANDAPVETQVTNAPPNQVLYSAGDIFIISLDDLQEVIMPQVILSKEG